MTAAIPDDMMQKARASLFGAEPTLINIARALMAERNRATEAERLRCADIAFDVMFGVSGAPMARSLRRRILAAPNQHPAGE